MLLSTQGFHQDMLQDYLEISGDWFFELDEVLRITFCYKNSDLPQGPEPSHFIGKPFASFLPQEYQNTIQNLLYANHKDEKSQKTRASYMDHAGCTYDLTAISIWRDQKFCGFRVSVRAQPDTHQHLRGSMALQQDNPFLFQLRQQELLVSMSMVFAGTEHFHTMIESALMMVGEFLDADRACICQDNRSTQTFSCVYEWASPHVGPILDSAQNLAYNSRWYNFPQLNSMPFVASNDTAELGAPQRGNPLHMDCRSFLNLPLFVDGSLWGFLAISTCRHKRVWSLGEINLLQTVGGIFSTVIEKQAVEVSLMETFTKLEGVVQNYPGIIWCLDNSGVFTLCEGQGLAVLNIRPEEVLGKHLHALPETNLVREIVDLGRPLSNRPVHSYMVDTSGRYLTCNTNILTDSARNIIGQMGVAFDITDLRTMQKKLELAIVTAEKANRAKSEFLSRMSHEIRTPMNAIIGMNTLARKTDDTEKIQYCLSRIESASKQLLEIINDVLDMSKIEAGKFEIRNAEFNFDSFLQSVCNVINVKLEEKRQRFTIDFDDVFFCNMISDELRLSQVMINLLTNAVKFTPEEGEIVLRIRCQDRDAQTSRLYVEVSDNGIGISPEHQKKLFQSFEQGDGGITRRFEGSGLGLAICKKIINLMGGEIWVESEEGKGSSFHFYVDVSWGKEYQETVTRLKLDGSQIRILVVDSHEDSSIYFKDVLDNFSLRSDLAFTGKKAVDMIREASLSGDPYTLVFLDWDLQDISGFSAARDIVGAAGNATLIVAMTAGDWSEWEAEAAELGITHCLEKPILPSAIFDAIVQLVDSAVIRQVVDHANENLNWQERWILLAEDIDVNREIVVGLLEDTGVKIDWVENGKEAVKAFREHPDRYDLVLMDISMPEMDGLQATRLIRQTRHPKSALPIIAMTANAFKEDVQQCLGAGMNGHVAKPVDYGDLVGKLAPYLGSGI